MSIEQALQDNTAALKALAIVLSSGVALAGAGAASDAASKPVAETKVTKETKKAEDKKVETPAGPDWKATLEKIKEVNASKLPTAGKDGVVAILTKFGKAGDKVPALEAAGKNAEIIAYADTLLAPPADGDDLGI